MYLITNGQIVMEHEILTGYELLVENDKITRLEKQGLIKTGEGTTIIDAKNGYVTPGFVDIHSDFIENMVAPRPNVMMDYATSLRETEKILINQGITTMFHSLSMWKSDEFVLKPIRAAENVRKFAELVDKSHTSKHLIRHRFHARLEIDNIEEVDNLIRYIEEDKVHLISFMDHTPGQGQYRDLEVYRKTLKGYRGITDDEVELLIQHGISKEKLTVETLSRVAALAAERNIAIASHDDDNIEKLEFVKSYSTSISEFPITMEVAEKAREMGMYTIAGAPNILLGGSHSGNLNAAEAIQKGVIDVLCSDYYPAAILHGVFQMHHKYGQKLCKMIALATINPARAVKMDGILGSIEEGKKADLLIVEKIEEDFPVITSVFVDGNLISRMDYRI